MAKRAPRRPDPARVARTQSKEQETQSAQQTAQSRAQQERPVLDLQGEDGEELFEQFTDPDLESDEFEELEAIIQPFMSQTQMLANHGENYYDDLSNELLNENLADRLIAVRDRPRLLTGGFLEVAQDVEHDSADVRRKPLSQIERSAVRHALVDGRTDRQSLGDKTLLEALTEIHVSSEVQRSDTGQQDGGSSGGLLGSLKPW